MKKRRPRRPKSTGAIIASHCFGAGLASVDRQSDAIMSLRVRHVVSLSLAAGLCSPRVDRGLDPDRRLRCLSENVRVVKADAVTECPEEIRGRIVAELRAFNDRHKRLRHVVGRRNQLLQRAIKSLTVLSHLASAGTVTCCATNSRLGWHARLVTAVCEAHLTTSPTLVACADPRGERTDSASRKADERQGEFRMGNVREPSSEPG